jgi:hypothetical protein
MLSSCRCPRNCCAARFVPAWVALEAFQGPRIEVSWQQIVALTLLPTSTAFLALSPRLVQLHPKPPHRHAEGGTKPIDGSRKLGAQQLEDADPKSPH